jgi:hypothetical protein
MAIQAAAPTPTTAEEIYTQVVQTLPPSERLRLATMILNDISPHAVIDYSEAWSEEDLREFSEDSWRSMCRRLEEEEENASAG